MDTEERLTSLEQRVDRLESIVSMFEYMQKQMDTLITLQKETNHLLRGLIEQSKK